MKNPVVSGFSPVGGVEFYPKFYLIGSSIIDVAPRLYSNLSAGNVVSQAKCHRTSYCDCDRPLRLTSGRCEAGSEIL